MKVQDIPTRVTINSNGCWEWLLYRTRLGYGQLHHDGRNGLHAHRVVYELLVGPIPNGLQLDHLCRNTSCVNPDHLEPVTGLENMRRRYAIYTQCTNGHPFDEANTYVRPSGHRDCRTCIRDRVRRYKERRSGAA